MFQFSSFGINLGNDGDGIPISSLFVTSLNLNDDDFPDLLLTLNAQNNNQVESRSIILLQSTGKTYINVTESLLPSGFSLQLARDLHVADFNGDGRDDVFFSNHGTEIDDPILPGEPNKLLLSNVDGKYEQAPDAVFPSFFDFSHHSSVGDFDNDGDQDIYVNNLGSEGGFGNYLLINDGEANFELIDTVPESSTVFDSFGFASSGTYATIAFDTDNDGDIDIFHSGIENGNGTVVRAYFENDGAGNFFFSENPMPVVVDPLHIETGDITGDGFADVVIFEDTGLGNQQFGFQVLINDGSGGFRDETERLGGLEQLIAVQDPGTTGNLQLIDIDADGDLDIFSIGNKADFSGNLSYVFENGGKGIFDLVPLLGLLPLTPTSFVINSDNKGPAEYFANNVNQDLWLEDPNNLFGLFSLIETTENDLTDPDPTGPTGTTSPTEAADRLFGTALDDTIDALSGNDTIVGAAGDDLLLGGRGNDNVKGSGGKDRLHGNSGDDTLKGGRGDDNIKGGGGSDNVKGNGGSDTIKAGGGSDTVKGGGGSDIINGGGGADRLEGGGGNDTITGRSGDDTLKGNGGSDTFQFRASDRNDTILDFRQGQDQIEIISGANAFAGLQIEQDGSDVLIGFGIGQIRVMAGNAGAFDESDFIF